ncbi:hypothetical protein RhiJN_26527 [Ceratobasidium sp. AG-Ba]|nr:hypothetical protein RhiJN_12474 [Ceratobasidium sp. AG-Ba]QRV98508.1 hypothetical protein RhiJN_26527 [Ceratobasidium sp. AG-Ba]
MPVERANISQSPRASPLPKRHYIIPSSLPPLFGINNLFDWSTGRSSSYSVSAQSSQSVTTITSPSVRGWVEKQQPSTAQKHKSTPETSSVLDISESTTSQRLLFTLSSPAYSTEGVPKPAHSLPTPIASPVWALKESQPPRPTMQQAGGTVVRERIEPTRKLSYWPREEEDEEEDEIEEEEGEGEGGSSEGDKPLVERASVADERNDKGWGEEMSEAEEDTGEGLVSDDESVLSDRGRMRDPVIKELEAAVKRYNQVRIAAGKSKRSDLGQTGTTALWKDKTGSMGGKWTGPSQGLISFRKRRSDQESIPSRKWSYATDGVAHQALKDREVGDLHFSPPIGGDGSEFDYWVVVDSPKRRWVTCIEGQSHPKLSGYVLQLCEGNKGPGWIRAQSLRANKCRIHKSI